MTTAEKLAQVKAILDITNDEDNDFDTKLTVFLTLVKNEILSWMYSGKTPEEVTDVPTQYEPTQVMAVVSGYKKESGIGNPWVYSDMVDYVRSHVPAFIEVI